MRAALIADFHGSSGGDLVNIIIIKAIVTKGFHVDIYTSTKEKLIEAYSSFEEKIPRKARIIGFKTILPNPYSIYFILKKIRNLNNYDVVILNDDIPKNLDNVKSMVYIHFPHAARVKYDVLVERKYTKSGIGWIKWQFHRKLFPHYFHINDSFEMDNIFLANSTLTQFWIRKLWPNTRIKILYPPVQVKKIIIKAKKSATPKKNQIVYVGRIIPEKGIEDIIIAISHIPTVKAKLIGPIDDYNYLKKLKKLLKKLNLEKRVEFTGKLPRNRLIDVLVQSKLIVHPAPFEPFGIAVVEGMAAGCIPVVKCGFNGPWMDILKCKERYGYCYLDIDELTEKVLQALNDKINILEIQNHAMQFDEKHFINNFICVLELLDL